MKSFSVIMNHMIPLLQLHVLVANEHFVNCTHFKFVKVIEYKAKPITWCVSSINVGIGE